MKILHVHGGDYAAMDFGREYTGTLAGKVMENPEEYISLDNEWQIDVLDFPDMVLTDDFKTFMFNELIGYDQSKSSFIWFPGDIISF